MKIPNDKEYIFEIFIWVWQDWSCSYVFLFKM